MANVDGRTHQGWHSVSSDVRTLIGKVMLKCH